MKRLVLSLFILVFVLSPNIFLSQQEAQEKTQEEAQEEIQEKPKPWQWSLDDIKSKVERIRAGKDLTPEKWPGDARVAVALSFDFDAETNALRDEEESPGLLSQGEYAARTAIPRILNLLDKYRIPATFFIPAVTAQLHPDSIAAIVEKGRHEIGMHGWIHERNSLLEEEVERELMKKSYDALQEITGKAPVGIRTPSWDFSLNTLKLIKELNLLYDSSLMADDRPYEILENGLPTGIVELPVEWMLDDYPYFGFSRYSSIRPHISPDDVYEIWKAEFEKAYQEGTVFILTMHPKYIGHRSRIMMLEKLIQHMLSFKNVLFATHESIARFAKRNIEE
ncbi:MAG: polysaccharide deacetylase [Candidatus Aminicenantes bacterium]|nr:polysaccharide deacetylase [Candidatus Aminicenantes bacterium]